MTPVHDTRGDRPANDAPLSVSGGEPPDEGRTDGAPETGGAEERAPEEAGYGYGV